MERFWDSSEHNMHERTRIRSYQLDQRNLSAVRATSRTERCFPIDSTFLIEKIIL